MYQYEFFFPGSSPHFFIFDLLDSNLRNLKNQRCQIQISVNLFPHPYQEILNLENLHEAIF